MGRVILKFKSGLLQSFKCKSEKRAEEIAKKRPNVIDWNFYGQNEKIPRPKRNEIEEMPQSFEEFEMRLKSKGVLT